MSLLNFHFIYVFTFQAMQKSDCSYFLIQGTFFINIRQPISCFKWQVSILHSKDAYTLNSIVLHGSIKEICCRLACSHGLATSPVKYYLKLIFLSLYLYRSRDLRFSPLQNRRSHYHGKLVHFHQPNKHIMFIR